MKRNSARTEDQKLKTNCQKPIAKDQHPNKRSAIPMKYESGDQIPTNPQISPASSH